MPRLLISDVLCWINVIPTVPFYDTAWAQKMQAKNSLTFSALMGKTGNSAQSRGLVSY